MLVVKATAASSPKAIAIASQASTFKRLTASNTGLNAGLIRLDNCARIRLNIAILGRALAHNHGDHLGLRCLILRTCAQEFTMEHDRNIVRDLKHLLDIVTNKYDRLALAAQGVDQLQDFLGLLYAPTPRLARP